jgi:hypothetical protein
VIIVEKHQRRLNSLVLTVWDDVRTFLNCYEPNLYYYPEVLFAIHMTKNFTYDNLATETTLKGFK